MSTYCVSDIHGEYERFLLLLEIIQFSESDTMYVIGDIIDRKPSGVDIAFYILEHPNIILMKGNHEQMCLDTLGPLSVYGARDLWQSNGGSPTRRELLYMCSAQERREVLRLFEKAPVTLELEVNGNCFYLVHGCPTEKGEGPLWDRVEIDDPRPFPDKTVIVGHTPTSYLRKDFSKPFTIWYGDGIIDIDCGCGNDTPNRRLACLRLDDMQEFYV